MAMRWASGIHCGEGGQVQERMPDAAVAPVEDRDVDAVAAHVARVEVAVDEGVGDAARLEITLASLEAVDQRLTSARRSAASSSPARRSSTRSPGRRDVGRRQSGRPEREQLVDVGAGSALDRDETRRSWRTPARPSARTGRRRRRPRSRHDALAAPEQRAARRIRRSARSQRPRARRTAARP